MINIDAIKAQYPDSQVNALGGKDMRNIRLMIAEIEMLRKLLLEAAVWIETEIEASECELPEAVDLVDRVLEKCAQCDTSYGS